MIKYVHSPVDRMCIAYTPASSDMPARASDVFKMTTVLCHKKDQYKKAVAREIALQNLSEGKYVLVKLPKHKQPHEHFQHIAMVMSSWSSEYDRW